MIIIIDNYDSFTYNLYQYIGEINPDIKVYRNDRITIGELEAQNPTHVVISPGPGYPSDAGISVGVIKELGGTVPILGVCLGHQAIGEAYGGRIVHSPCLVHGKQSDINLSQSCELFKSLPSVIKAGRYHSLVIERNSIPECLEITAHTSDDTIMAIKHIDYEVYGIQFHPESILTDYGKDILRNFLNVRRSSNV